MSTHTPIHDPIEQIIRHVAEQCGVAPQDLTGPCRARYLFEARAAAAYVIRSCLPAISLVTIGMRLGGRDHTTIINALDRVRGRMDAEPAYAEALARIVAELRPQLRFAGTLYSVVAAKAA